ncbi:MAG: ribosome recycling factor [Burkholderiales bacterium]|nr:ribosome recycling factor [Burkholderiales bacterium]
MELKELFSQTQHHMKRTIETLKQNLTKIRTGRANPALLDQITVEYYGSPTPLPQVAQLGLADARTITVQPWERKMIAVVEKAIRESDLGLNPSNNGEVIRVPMPPLTEERRREITKVVRNEGEDAKVAIRNLRREVNTEAASLLKDKEITEDEERKANTDVQKLTDKWIGEIDKLIEEKVKEVMTV